MSRKLYATATGECHRLLLPTSHDLELFTTLLVQPGVAQMAVGSQTPLTHPFPQPPLAPRAATSAATFNPPPNTADNPSPAPAESPAPAVRNRGGRPRNVGSSWAPVQTLGGAPSPAGEDPVAYRTAYERLNDLGTVKFTLGAKILQQPRLQTITINQSPFIDDIVAKFGDDLGDAKTRQRVVPITEQGMDFERGDPEDPETKEWANQCLKLGGKLNYVAIFTRPDISFALSVVMGNVSMATKGTYGALLGILRYLRDTKDYSIPTAC
ncbi:hypothetical protein AB1Y20_023202 [Prymnesium parvum]|uniref:Reverse transcriptase Ty1/copia-type domain-containing protein n=1 Tax=Prymnesium parvum TaxID=97485 RepID=A0AB34JER1_PRYPA